jgi:hypothetical protein
MFLGVFPMMRKVSKRILFWALLVSLTAVLTTVDKPVLADGPVKKVLKKERTTRGRLPNYYTNIVNEEQKEKILKIQEEYKPKLEALEAQLKSLKKERDDKISAVLTEEQKKKVEEAKAKAKEKGDAPDTKKSDTTTTTKPAEAAPPAPPETKPAT